MESWLISWRGGTLPLQKTVVFSEDAVKVVKRNVKKFGGKYIRVKHHTETYAQIKRRERAMGIKQ